jgi:transcription initiation factor IIE alpha subunit
VSLVWRLVDAIPDALRPEVGLTDDQLANRFKAAAADVRRAVAILYRQDNVDRCWTGTESYVVLPAAPAMGEASGE